MFGNIEEQGFVDHITPKVEFLIQNQVSTDSEKAVLQVAQVYTVNFYSSFLQPGSRQAAETNNCPIPNKIEGVR